jgi:hypothetical protein
VPAPNAPASWLDPCATAALQAGFESNFAQDFAPARAGVYLGRLVIGNTDANLGSPRKQYDHRSTRGSNVSDGLQKLRKQVITRGNLR